MILNTLYNLKYITIFKTIIISDMSKCDKEYHLGFCTAPALWQECSPMCIHGYILKFLQEFAQISPFQISVSNMLLCNPGKSLETFLTCRIFKKYHDTYNLSNNLFIRFSLYYLLPFSQHCLFFWSVMLKRSVFTPIPNKGNAKECSNYHTIALISQASNVQDSPSQASIVYEPWTSRCSSWI